MGFTDFKSGSSFWLLIEEDRNPEIEQRLNRIIMVLKEDHFYINLTFYRKEFYP